MTTLLLQVALWLFHIASFYTPAAGGGVVDPSLHAIFQMPVTFKLRFFFVLSLTREKMNNPLINKLYLRHSEQ